MPPSFAERYSRQVPFAGLGPEGQRRLAPHGVVQHYKFILKLWREPFEITQFPWP
jgi:hypothetical protein